MCQFLRYIPTSILISNSMREISRLESLYLYNRVFDNGVLKAAWSFVRVLESHVLRVSAVSRQVNTQTLNAL